MLSVMNLMRRLFQAAVVMRGRLVGNGRVDATDRPKVKKGWKQKQIKKISHARLRTDKDKPGEPASCGSFSDCQVKLCGGLGRRCSASLAWLAHIGVTTPTHLPSTDNWWPACSCGGPFSRE